MSNVLKIQYLFEKINIYLELTSNERLLKIKGKTKTPTGLIKTHISRYTANLSLLEEIGKVVTVV